MNDYQIRFANKAQELEEAQRLRFEVFNLEIKNSNRHTFTIGLDKDKYDSFCEHLIILDPKKEKIIGTYRLLLSSKINEVGFYSEGKFDLTNIKKLDCEMLELGRSCIHKDYRNQNVLELLWRGIAGYIFKHNIKYVFGSPSLQAKDSREVSEIFSYLKKRFYSEEKFRVFPLKKYKVKDLELDVSTDGKKILKNIPPLIRSYLKIGAKVCGPPAINPELNTIVFFMLLDVNDINDAYKKHFLKADS